jgi:prohibitin 1
VATSLEIMYKSFSLREPNNRWCRWLLQEEQKKLAAIIRAEGDAQGAQLLAKALTESGGGLVELRRIEAAEDIAYQLSQSPNVIYLPSKQQALLNIPSH